jgi:NADPH-dependent 2,4-dienoyl-CoA reductase/sulfur reductase-like enzyme
MGHIHVEIKTRAGFAAYRIEIPDDPDIHAVQDAASAVLGETLDAWRGDVARIELRARTIRARIRAKR